MHIKTVQPSSTEHPTITLSPRVKVSVEGFTGSGKNVFFAELVSVFRNHSSQTSKLNAHM